MIQRLVMAVARNGQLQKAHAHSKRDALCVTALLLHTDLHHAGPLKCYPESVLGFYSVLGAILWAFIAKS